MWLSIFSFVVFFVLLIWLIIRLFNKKPKKKILLGLLICLVLFIMGALTDNTTVAGSDAAPTPEAVKSSEEIYAEENDLTLAQAENMLSLCTDLGLSAGKLSIGEDGAPYFSQEGYTFSVVFSGDDVSKIYSGTMVFYDNGEIKQMPFDLLPTTEEAIQYITASEDLVKSVLKAPSTAEFPGEWYDPQQGWRIDKRDGQFWVSSYVDALNSFGAMIRSDFYITFENETAIYFVFDGSIVFDYRT